MSSAQLPEGIDSRKEAYKRQTIKRATCPKRKAYIKAYREANRDRINQYKSQWYERTAETRKAQQEARYLANKDVIDKQKAERIAEGKRKSAEAARAKWAQYYAANKDEVDTRREAARQRKNERDRLKRSTNIVAYREKEREKDKRRYRSEKWLLWRKAYLKRTKEQRTKYMTGYHKARRQMDTEFRLRYILRKRTLGILARLNVTKTWQKPIAFLGCTIAELRDHIERQFEPWMTWDNHGQYGWHIDHIRPLSKYNLEDPEQFAKACHYTNLRPLHWKENLSKGAKTCS